MPQLNFSNLLVLSMVAMLGWAGFSAVRGAIRLNRTYLLEPNRFIYPANCSPELCRDPVGFIGFITPRLWGFGAVALVLCAFLLVNEFTDLFSFLPGWFRNATSMFLFLPPFVWYIIFINKAAKRFW